MADDDITQGLKTAVEAVEPADDEDDGPEPPAHQMPLFPSDRLDELADDAAGRQAQYREPRRGPGRPPGAKNKRTTDWIGYLERRYPSPLITLAEMRSRPARQLAEELGCKPLEAAALQVRCADIEAPYWHGKKPIDVNIQGQRPMLVMTDPNAWLASFEAQCEAGEILDMTAVRVRSAEMFEGEQNQALGAAVAGLVGRAELDKADETQASREVDEAEPLIGDQLTSDGGEP